MSFIFDAQPRVCLVNQTPPHGSILLYSDANYAAESTSTEIFQPKENSDYDCMVYGTTIFKYGNDGKLSFKKEQHLLILM